MPALILCVLPWLSLFVHEDLNLGLAKLGLSYYWILAFVTFLAASQMPILPWLRAFLCGVFIAFCYAMIHMAGWLTTGSKPSALGNSILFSQFLATAIVLLSILYKHDSHRSRKRLYLIGMCLFFLGLMLGEGRSGILAVVVLFPLIFTNILKQKNRAKIIAMCLIASSILVMSPMVRSRIQAGVNDLQLFQKNETQTSLGYRFDMWSTAWNVFLENPIIGAGPSGFRHAWVNHPRSAEAAAFLEPHNAFLFYASSYGVIGLAALIWLYAALVWTGWANRQSLEGAVVFVFAVIGVLGSFTNTMVMGTASHALFMLFIGLQGGLLYTSRHNGKNP